MSQDYAGYESWIGDGWCDDGTYGLYFNCDEFDNDGGDCGESVIIENALPSTEDLSDLPAGTYTVVATDENGCSVSI